MTDPAPIDVLPGLDTVLHEATTPETPLRYLLSGPPWNLDRRGQTRLLKKWRETASVGVDAMKEVLWAEFWLRTERKPEKATEGFLRNWVKRAVGRKIQERRQAVEEEHGPVERTGNFPAVAAETKPVATEAEQAEFERACRAAAALRRRHEEGA